MMPDVVIIGGGIIGCSCAYYLSAAGLKVHLLEKGAIGSGASKAGMCHIVTWEEPAIHLKLELASKKLYDGLKDVLPIDIEYRPTGSLALIDSESTFLQMSEMTHRLRARGHICEMLTGEEMLKREPFLSPVLFGGAYFDDDVQVNPMRATNALAMGARNLGAVIEPYAEVMRIELNEQKNRVEAVVTQSGRIPTKSVVNAAGAWAGSIGEMVGLEIPIIPRKGHLAITEPVPVEFLHHKTLFSAGYLDAVMAGDDLAVACNIQQTPNGHLLLGSSRQFVGFNTNVDPAVLSPMLNLSVKYFPFLSKVKVIRTWAGLRPYTPDLLPIISSVSELDGYYIAAGHEGLGITEGPITGKLITQLITKGEPDIALDALSYSRFVNP